MKRTTELATLAAIAAASLALAACNSSPQGVRFLDGNGQSSKPQPEPVRNLSADQIFAAIAGKTFQYTRADGNGFITYNSDGTFSFQDDVKGAGSGRWLVNGTQFCETFGAAAPTDCGEFKATGDAYFAAKSRLVEMKT